MADTTLTLEKPPLDAKTAIKEAVAGLDLDGNPKAPEKKEEPGEKKETKEPTEKPKEVAEEALELEQAKQLYKALKDPSTRDNVIEYIAKQGGYTKGEKAPETKQEIKEAKDEIKAALAEALGDEFSFLTDKLGPALDKIITKKLQDGLQETREALEAQEQEKLNAKSEKALTKLSNEFFGEDALPENVKSGIKSYMDKIAPSPDMDVKDYLEMAFYSTIGRLGITRKDAKTEIKINKNRTDAPARLAQERGPGSVTTDTAKIMSRRAAILAAVEAEEAKGS